MNHNDDTRFRDSIQRELTLFEMLKSEANTVRENDKILIRNLFKNFYNKKLKVGIGFQRSYGSILAGDYFDLIKLPNDCYLFIFADISGHGLPAYTTLIRLRSAITIALKNMRKAFEATGLIDTDFLIKDICILFTDIMDESNSEDFACVNFTFIRNEDDKFHLKFYNRSMLFPIVVRRYEDEVKDVYNLNYSEKSWEPQKGYLLGSDIRKLLDDSYLDTPSCEFTIYESDILLFYSDGIVEAYNHKNPLGEFGDERLKRILLDNIDMPPQLIINLIFEAVYEFIGHPENQKDDMTAVLINFPAVRDNA